MTSLLEKFNTFTNRITLWNNLLFFQSFTAPIATLKNYNFFLTDFVIYITWNLSNFRSSSWLLKNLIFFANRFLFEKLWKNSNFQSSNILFKNFILFMNRFRAWDNLNYFRFRAWLACLENSNFLQDDSNYQVHWNKSKFQSLNRHLTEFNFFADRFLLWKNLLYFKVSKLQ